MRGAATGPLAGVPMLLKDLVAEVEGVRFTEGSRFLADNVSTYTSELVRRFEAAGLVIIGKSATPEFGMSPSCEGALFGPTRNPWDLTRSTSGSSGGSAAAVAAGIVPIAHANDLGGSIRYPASNCGLFGLKPTRARNPPGSRIRRRGQRVGGRARRHAQRARQRRRPGRDQRPDAGRPRRRSGARPAVSAVRSASTRAACASGSPRCTGGGEPGHRDCVAGLEKTAALLAELGHDVVETEPAGPDGGGGRGHRRRVQRGHVVDRRVLGARLGREPGADELEPLTRAYWEMGQDGVGRDGTWPRSNRCSATRVRVAAFFVDDDLFLNPTMSLPPLPLGEMVSTPDDPLHALEVSGPSVAYSGVIANLTGQPAMSVPLHWTEDGLPIGMHFLGRYGDEATLLRLAGQLEQACPWADRRPLVFAR